MDRFRALDFAGLLVLGVALAFFLWLGAAKRQLERRRQRASSSLR